jgi:hypothetical protein
MNKYIFVDLDETLIHTYGLFSKSAMPGYQKITLGSKEHYNTKVRECSVAFLEQARKKAKVFMLTVATRDYALAMNKAFSFGFEAEDIYSREDIRGRTGKIPQIEPGAVWLFDNLPEEYNEEKCRYLAHLGPLNYVQVSEFDHYSGSSTTLPDYTVDKEDISNELLTLLAEKVK